MINDRTTITAIAKIFGSNRDYMKAYVKSLCAEHGLTYNPVTAEPKTDPGLGAETRAYRARLGDKLYEYRSDRCYVEVQSELGMSNKAQNRAAETPMGHDWLLSQQERLAESRGTTFKQQTLECLLTEEEYAWIQQLWNSKNTSG